MNFLAVAADSLSIPTSYIAVFLAALVSTAGYVAKQAVAQAKINERVATLLDDHAKRVDRLESTLLFVKHV